MRTARLLTVCLHGGGGVHPSATQIDASPLDAPMDPLDAPPWMHPPGCTSRGQTDACENITFPQPRLRTVINDDPGVFQGNVNRHINTKSIMETCCRKCRNFGLLRTKVLQWVHLRIVYAFFSMVLESLIHLLTKLKHKLLTLLTKLQWNISKNIDLLFMVYSEGCINSIFSYIFIHDQDE